ncbi:DNA-binding protein [Thioclava electrotropha]|uniref:KfrA N-terminal DNA-binding domain-containing protein n=1 Tax=Thioclava electrotropha TaxID=1549850 RepID=A0ABX6YUN7_9RHOB|nr:DNA-binding protein [Thioclava electrotropha]QPZ91572.1 hypothetical protein AKL02_012145 [Thioclava electrotropha]
MAKRTPSAAVRKRILAAVREVEKTGTVTNQSVLKYLQDNKQGASMSDVQTIVKEYREEAEAHAATMSAVPPMPDEVVEMNMKMWSLIWKKADEPVAAIKAYYAAELEKRNLFDAERESDMLIVEADLDAATDRAEKAEAALAEVKESLVNARMEIARLEGRLAERLSFKFISPNELNGEVSDGLRKGENQDDAALAEVALRCEDTEQLDMFGGGPVDTSRNAGANDVAAE